MAVMQNQQMVLEMPRWPELFMPAEPGGLAQGGAILPVTDLGAGRGGS